MQQRDSGDAVATSYKAAELFCWRPREQNVQAFSGNPEERKKGNSCRQRTLAFRWSLSVRMWATFDG